jgi:hypothetical protein
VAPPIDTGEAAPTLVPGAIAATWAAYRMKVPALAARAPLGATNTATGTGEARIALMTSRIEVSSPPGVSRWMTTSSTPPFAARSMARFTKWALAGPIAPSSGTRETGAARAHADQSRPMRTKRAMRQYRGCSASATVR